MIFLSKKISDEVVKGYKAIEKGVTDGFKAINDKVVSSYTKIEDLFVERYLMKDGETVEDSKKRLKEEEKERSKKQI